ncbi:hypothetical protein [Mucilaginibacter sp.]|jgi:hypothetical protein|uniref:hypothetical protein n=1 Tax=Mucilaginibacter sp. TaxID=1882438 RepID=UPI002C0D737E|nr:hypothetical protein [Mucilaginibacter sp.]HTI58330.1 hypothetical protein [Mucilaginibacter sp.]
MKPRTAYIPQQQFHLLIHFKGDQRSVAVLPSQVGQFLVVDQGRVLGELAYDSHLNCVSAHCEVEPRILTQIKKGIRKHYS